VKLLPSLSQVTLSTTSTQVLSRSVSTVRTLPLRASPSMTWLVFCSRFSRWSTTSSELAAQSIRAM
jgi:hypothetical protein